MADKKIVFSEPAGYFPKSVLKELGLDKSTGSKKKPAAKKKTVKRK